MAEWQGGKVAECAAGEGRGGGKRRLVGRDLSVGSKKLGATIGECAFGAEMGVVVPATAMRAARWGLVGAKGLARVGEVEMGGTVAGSGAVELGFGEGAGVEVGEESMFVSDGA